MSFAQRISLDLEKVSANARKLAQSESGIPSSASVAEVTGSDTERAQADFHATLSEFANGVSARADAIRRFVVENADALNRAAATLQGTDEHGASVASNGADFISETVASGQSESASTSGTSTDDGW